MHEAERHRLILSAVETRSVATLADLVSMTGASEATIRRDIAALDGAGRLRRVRGGAEAINPPAQGALIGRPFTVNETIRVAEKRAIARAAAELCRDGEPVILNGGTTTFQMVSYLEDRRMTVFTNSFAIAEHLIARSRNNVVIPGGSIYREQSIILSPFGGVVARHFYARRMFIGCQGLGPQGLMEADPLIVQAEMALIGQAEDLVVLADSTKFMARSSLIVAGLDKVSLVITDSGLRPEDRAMLEDAGVDLLVVDP